MCAHKGVDEAGTSIRGPVENSVWAPHEPQDAVGAGASDARANGRWRLDYQRFEAAKCDTEGHAGESLLNGALGLAKPGTKDQLRRYYRRQNDMIEGFGQMDALEEHLLAPTDAEEKVAADLAKSEWLAIKLSNVLNIVLLIAKIFCSVETRSLAIIASTLDSLLDVLSGLILYLTARSMRVANPYKYPIGKKRMQPLGIIVFASVMAMLGLQVLVEGIRELVSSSHHKDSLDSWPWLVGIMVGATAVKLGLYLYCKLFDNDIIQAYAQDHIFDVITNVIGLAAALLAAVFAWWIDPVGAILLALYTMKNWGAMVLEHVASLTGQSATPEFLQKLTYLCWNHHEAIIQIDTVRAYTFGSHYFAEVDIVLPASMPLQDAHDIGEALQNKLERVPEIERAFVHLDYEVSHRPEHQSVFAPIGSQREASRELVSPPAPSNDFSAGV